MKIAKNVLETSGKGSTNSKSCLKKNKMFIMYFFFMLYNIMKFYEISQKTTSFFHLIFTPHLITFVLNIMENKISPQKIYYKYEIKFYSHNFVSTTNVT